MTEKRCSTCHLLRPLTGFNVRSKAPDGLQARYRECSRDWYVQHKVTHIRNVRLRNDRGRLGVALAAARPVPMPPSRNAPASCSCSQRR